MSCFDGEEEDGGEKSNQGRVLIVDDDAIIRISTGQALMRIGYKVEYAKDGVNAIGLYTRALKGSKPFDVVIMDLTFPEGMGGREIIKRLIEIDPQLKAIACSGYLNDPVMSEYKDYGFRGVLSKPYSIEDLATTIHKVINEE